MMPNLYKTALSAISVLLFMFSACQTKPEEQTEYKRSTSAQKTADPLPKKDKPNRKVITFEPKPKWKAKIKILQGQEFIDSGWVAFEMEMIDSSYYIIIAEVNLPKPKEYPQVWNSKFKKYEKANKLDLHASGFYQKRKFYEHHQRVYSSKYVRGEGSKKYYELKILPEDLKGLESGNGREVEINIMAVYASFFKVPSDSKPFEVRFSVPIDVFDIYKTQLYFHSFTLKEAETKQALGENDFSNDAPEPAIDIRHLGERIHYKHTSRNGYKLIAPASTTVFHTQKQDDLIFEFEDRDFFLNPNDAICNQTISLDTIQGTSYRVLSFKCVESLKVYARTSGKVN